MPRAGLADILAAVEEQIRGVYDNEDVPIIEAMLLPNPASTPAVDIYPGALARDTETAGFGDLAGAYLLTVRARVATNDLDASQTLLVEMMDDQSDLSLAAAAVDDHTLNGNASSLDILENTGFQVYADINGAGAFVGFQFTLLVIPGES